MTDASIRDETDTLQLTVIITVVDAGVSLERCLQALADQTDPPSMEVLIPYDHISRSVREFVDRFPDFTFIDQGEILGGLIPKNAFEEHKFIDARRSAAIEMAKGELVSILDDRGVPRNDWAATMVQMHEEFPDYSVIGGAVENGENKSLNWAAFICDFGRYQPPLEDDDPEYVSDTNICYKREALDCVREFWRDQRFDEAQVNWALRRKGKKLKLSDRPRTLQIREPMSIARMAGERYHWGRNFGQSRVSSISGFERFKLCLLMPFLPIVLIVRYFRRQLEKGHHVKEFVISLPALTLLILFWTAGEFIGYCEGTPPERFEP
jgi:hypothetical protein